MTLRLLLEPRSAGAESLILTVVACGADYLRDWERLALPSWERYAERQGYGLAVLSETRLPADANVAWNKFILPRLVRDELGHPGNVLVLDADQAISPLAPAIDTTADSYGLVALEEWTDETVRNRKLTGFLRRSFIDADYPLDSVLIMSRQDWEDGQLLDLGGALPISSGFMLVPPNLVDEFAGLVEFVFDPDAAWDGGGGDQIFASRELQKRRHHFLDRRWQGIWPSIMSDRYPSLYFELPVPVRTAQAAVASALFDHWCIHFATSWPEKQFWGVDWLSYWDERFGRERTDELNAYHASAVSPRSYGRLPAPEVRLIADTDR